MSVNNKVIWSEGMFIRPQHFQQQDRYMQYLLNENNRLLINYAYGITDIKLDTELLAMGRISVLNCRGIFPDGSYFNTTEDNSFIEILEVPENTRDTLVYMTLPLRHPNIAEVATDDKKTGLARFVATEFDVPDNTSSTADAAAIHLGKMHLRLMLEGEDLSQFACLPIARIIEIRDKEVILDNDFIAPCLDCKSFAKLKGYLLELQTLLQQRRQLLAERLGDVNRGNNMSAVSDLLLLQLASRFESTFNHMLHLQHVHPQELFAVLLQLASELNVFTKKKTLNLPIYDHENLQTSFEPLLTNIRRGLSLILQNIAELMPLEKQKEGISVATISNRALLDECIFIFKVKADMDIKELVKRFPDQVKVGPVEEIKQLIRSQLAGIKLKLLPVAPAQLPYQANCSYFALEATGELWQKMKKSAGFALHVGGDFPNLQVELWAVREE